MDEWSLYCGIGTPRDELNFLDEFQFEGSVEQECIPVGCVPPAHYRTQGISLSETPGQRPPGERPPRQTTLDRNYPGQRLPGQSHVTCGACWDRDPL